MEIYDLTFCIFTVFLFMGMSLSQQTDDASCMANCRACMECLSLTKCDTSGKASPVPQVEATTRRPTTPKATTPAAEALSSCHYVDLLFIVDESQSLTDEDFEEIKVFLWSFAEQLGEEYIGQRYIRVAMISFAYDAFVEFTFDQIHNSSQYARVIDNLPRRNGLTYTAKAFNMARYFIFQPERGYREATEVPSVIIFITDGNYDEEGGDPAISAEEIRLQHGTTIYSVAVQSDFEERIDINKLIEISGDPNYVFELDRFDELSIVVTDLIKTNCKKGRL